MILSLPVNKFGDNLVIDLFCKLDEIFIFNDIAIKYVNKETYFLTIDCLFYLMNHLQEMFKSAIKNELQLHKSINKNIGYLRNQYLHDSIECREGNKEELPHWNGDKYHLFSTPGNADISLVTWLYNNKHCDIILEITPGYKWFFKEPDPNETYVSYDEFMKNYKSIYTATIPLSFAKTLLMQFDILLNQSKKNEKKHNLEEIQKS